MSQPPTDAAAGFSGRVVQFLIRWRTFILPIVVALAAGAWPLADRLQFDQSIQSLYADEDPHLKAWSTSRRLFGGDEFAAVAWDEEGLFDAETGAVSEASRQRLDAMAHRLSQVPGVVPESTQHVGTATDIELGMTAAIEKLDLPAVFTRLAPLLDWSEKEQQAAQFAEGMLVGRDRRTTAVVVRLKSEEQASVSRGETIARIREIAAAHDPPASVVGESVQVHDMFRYVEEDGRVLFHVSLALLSAVLFVMFRSLRWVILPLAVVVLTVRWTGALMVLSGAKLSMVSSMLNSLVTIIGVATATHLAIGFRDRRRTMPRAEALSSTLNDLIPPILWTCGTTAVGFLALLSSEITPVRSFGLMMGVATLLVFVIVCLLTPSGMARWRAETDEDRKPVDGPQRFRVIELLLGDPVPAPAERHLVRLLTAVSRFVARQPWIVGSTAVAIVILSGLGLKRLDVETDFSRNFRKNSSIVQALDFYESRVGGAGTLEVNFPAPDSEHREEFDEEYLDRVRVLATRLREELLVPDDQRDDPSASIGRLTKVVSLTDGLDMIPREIPIPFFPRPITVRQRHDIMTAFQREVVESLYNAREGRMRIVLRAVERQRAESKRELMTQVSRIAREEFGSATTDVGERDAEDGRFASEPAADQPETTGLFVLLTFLIESLLRDQVVSFVIAAVGIGTMMSVAFRSVRIGLISLIPNLFPIVFVIGTMGWIGLPINIATAMIASVSMGLTVDSSVHYLSAYRRARNAGATVSAAIEQTQTQVGRALVYANVALVAGFSVLTLSHFIPLVYFGILVSVAMLGGLAGNLFLLPLLLTWIDRSSSELSGKPADPDPLPA